MITLHPEQRYVSSIAYQQSIELKLMHHDRATSTCAEKAELLSWDVGRVVKALYAHPGDFSEFIGIITPQRGIVSISCAISAALGIDAKSAGRYTANGYTPTGMSSGTCTPFPRTSLIGKEISQLIILDFPDISDTLVDISVGDDVDDPHKTSMHLPYRAIYTILSSQFGERVHLLKQ